VGSVEVEEVGGVEEEVEEAGRRREDPEVMVSEVLVLDSRSGELRAGGGGGCEEDEEARCSGSRSRSESRLW